MNGHFALLNRLHDGSGIVDFIQEEIRKKEAGVRGEVVRTGFFFG